MDVLRWHVYEQLLHTRMRMSDLLFPAVTGGFRARSVLDKPFDEASKAISLNVNFTPWGMRRTYQDLSPQGAGTRGALSSSLRRVAGIHDALTRGISGHATPAMQFSSRR